MLISPWQVNYVPNNEYVCLNLIVYKFLGYFYGERNKKPVAYK